MAINFLNNVNFNSIQSENIVIENFASDALAGNGVSGQIYWNTSSEELRGWDGNAGAWISIGSDNDVLTFAGGSGGNQTVLLKNQTFNVAGTANQIVTTGSAQTLTIAFPTIVTLPTSSIVATTPAAGDNSLKIATTAFVKTAVEASDTLAEILAIGNTTGGTDIAISAGDDITFTATSAIVDPGSSKGTAGQYLASTGTTIDWLDLPIDPNEKYTLPVTALAGNKARVSLTGSTDGVVSTVDFIGTAGRIAITSQDQNNGSITIDFPDNVTIADNLTVSGIISQIQTGETNTLSSPLDMGGTTGTPAPNKIINLATGTAATDAVNLGQVELLVAGVGVFQGGYNATTDPGVPKISGGSNVALDQGDYFVVSHDGDITFSGVTTSGSNSGALDNSTALVLQSANTNIVVGMTVTGTGVPSGVTIKTVTNSTNFVLSGAITIPNATSLSFSNRVVKVEVGDFIFANAAITASSDPAASAYTIVQSDANIAGAGATDGATEKGVAGFDSANFAVSASGWVQLKPLANPYGAKVALTSGDNTTAGQTTFTVDVTALFAGADARNCKVEVLLDAGGLTVYPEVTRNGTGDVLLEFMPQVGNNLYSALITIV